MKTKPGFRIKEVWAYVSVDPTTDEEGIIGMKFGDTYMPFVCADDARREQLRPMAEAIARSSNTTVKLVRLSERTELETIYRSDAT